MYTLYSIPFKKNTWQNLGQRWDLAINLLYYHQYFSWVYNIYSPSAQLELETGESFTDYHHHQGHQTAMLWSALQAMVCTAGYGLHYRPWSARQAMVCTTGQGLHHRLGSALQARVCTTGHGLHHRPGSALHDMVCTTGHGLHYRPGSALQARVCTTGQGLHYRTLSALPDMVFTTGHSLHYRPWSVTFHFGCFIVEMFQSGMFGKQIHST